MMASPETLLAQGWLATLTGLSLALNVLNSFHGLCPRKNLVLSICLRYAASRQPFGLVLTAFASSHNLSLRTSCMSQIMPHPRPLGVSCPSQFQYKTKKTPLRCLLCFRAGKGTRTLDPDLGKVVLYQLSYSREDSPYIEIKFLVVKGEGLKK